MKKILITLVAAWLALSSAAAESLTLSLDSCRSLALKNNKEMQMASAKQQKAYYDRKAAFTKFFPRVNALGVYMFTSKQIELLSQEQKDGINHAGTDLQQKAQQQIAQSMQSEAMMQLMQIPGVAELLPQALQKVNTTTSGAANAINAAGQEITSAIETDTRNLAAISVMLTQPIYMGGKIKAYYSIMKKVEELTGIQDEGKENDVILEVDEAYWRIVSLKAKRDLAASYLATLDTLSHNVDKLIEAGFATKADGLSVRVKLNEARVTMVQVENGIALSRMALMQICGLDLATEFELEDETIDVDKVMMTTVAMSEGEVNQAVQQRHEIRSLTLASQIADEKVKIARSEFLPSVVLTGGYLTTYPSVLDGFQKEFGGMWNVGVMMKVPIITCGERIYKVRSARCEAEIAKMKTDEASEKISLQINQMKQKKEEAEKRLATAEGSINEAMENLRYANLGLKEGMIAVSDVLQAETALLKAQSTSVEAKIDVMLSDLYLRKAMGQSLRK